MTDDEWKEMSVAVYGEISQQIEQMKNCNLNLWFPLRPVAKRNEQVGYVEIGVSTWKLSRQFP